MAEAGAVAAKLCIRCEMEKPRNAFGRISSSRDGRSARCLDCHRRYRYGLDLRVVHAARGGQCGVCQGAVAFEDAAWDHIIPRSAGGPDTVDNLQPTHNSCNALKHVSSLERARTRAKTSKHVGAGRRHAHSCVRCGLRWQHCTVRHRWADHRIICDGCFDHAVEIGLWTTGMSTWTWPSADLAQPDVVFTDRGSRLVEMCGTTRPESALIDETNRAYPTQAPWRIDFGPVTCPDDPSRRVHYYLTARRRVRLQRESAMRVDASNDVALSDLNVRVPRELHEAVKEHARAHNVRMRDFIADAVSELLRLEQEASAA